MSLPVVPVSAHPTSLPVVRDDRLLATAVACGVGLGVLDLALQVTLPYPLANLANSSAVWALCAFGLAAVARTTPVRSALAGSVLLVVAVVAYYVAAVVVGMADVGGVLSGAATAWAAFGVLAGVVFGVAGSWLRSDRAWLAAGGLAAAAAVFYAEASLRLLRASALADLGTSLLTCAIGTAVLLSAVPRPAHLARAATLVAPLTLLGMAAFSLARF